MDCMKGCTVTSTTEKVVDDQLDEQDTLSHRFVEFEAFFDRLGLEGEGRKSASAFFAQLDAKGMPEYVAKQFLELAAKVQAGMGKSVNDLCIALSAYFGVDYTKKWCELEEASHALTSGHPADWE
jgi:hypothetical protein